MSGHLQASTPSFVSPTIVDFGSIADHTFGGPAALFGVSPDKIESHQKFKKKFDLPFPLLADPDHTAAEAYGAWGEKSMYGKKYPGILRSTFVIDEKGKIARVFEKVKPEGHAAQVLEALR